MYQRNGYSANVWKRNTTLKPTGVWDFTDHTVANARWYSGGASDIAQDRLIDGTIWQDGMPTLPKRVGLNGGWQVLAVNPSDNQMNATGFALGDTTSGSTAARSGGQRLAEVIIYDSLLDDGAIARVGRYLTKKWLNRVQAGYDDDARIACVRAEHAVSGAGESYLSNGATPTVTVAAGQTLKIDQFLGGQGGYPTFTKNGAGTLEIGGMSSYQGTLVMDGGTFSFRRRAIPTAMPKAGDIYADFDSSVSSSILSTEPDANGTKYVTNWVSVTDRAFKINESKPAETYRLYAGPASTQGSYPQYDFRPFLNPLAFGGTRTTVDFGTAWEWGRKMSFPDPTTGKGTRAVQGITTVFLVMNAQGVGGFPVCNTGENGSSANYFEPKTGGGYSSWTGQKLGEWTQTVPQGRAPTNSWIYVNGVRRSPTAGYPTPGWQVIAMQGPGSTVCGLGYGWSAYYGSGCEMAEVVFYNQQLTEEELLDAQAYLANKWFGCETPGYRRVAARAAVADVPKMKVTAPSTVYVAAGDTMRVGALTLEATLEKTGPGTLEVEAATGAGTYLVLKEGNVRGAAAPTQTETCRPAKDAALWLDANDLGGSGLSYGADSVKVRMWHGHEGDNGATMTTGDYRPIYRTNALNGMPVVDFGQFDGWKWMNVNKPMDSVRTIFVVGDYYEGGNILGTQSFGEYTTRHQDFMRNGAANQPILARNDNNRQVWGDGSSIKIDGAAETFSWTPPKDEFHLIEIQTMAGCHGSTLMYNECVSNGKGGGRVAEMIVYERALTEREKTATRNYLMKKWFNRAEEALPAVDATPAVELAEVDVAAGTTVTLDNGGSALVVGRFSGAGTIVKSGSGVLSVGPVDDFTGDVQVEAGKLKLTAQSAPVLAEDGLRLWLDAAEGVTTVEMNSKTCVTNWANRATSAPSLAALGHKYGDASMTLPVYKPNGGPDDRPYVYFPRGSYFRFMENMGGDAYQYRRFTDVRTVFWIIGSQDGGGMLLGDSTTEGGNAPAPTFLRVTTHSTGFPGYYKTDPLLADSAQKEVREAEWHENGSTVDPMTTGLSGGWDIVSCCLREDAAKAASADGCAYVGGHRDNQWKCGFQNLAELLVYNRRLSVDEVCGVESFLAGKYGLNIGAVERTFTNGLNVTVSSGATLESSGRSRYVDGVSGGGSLVGRFAIGNYTAGDAPVGIDGTLLIPEGVTVDVSDLDGDVQMAVLAQATSYDGWENLDKAVFVRDGQVVTGTYRLRVKNGQLCVFLRTGFVITVR